MQSEQVEATVASADSSIFTASTSETPTTTGLRRLHRMDVKTLK